MSSCFYFWLEISFPIAVFAVIWRIVGIFVKFGPCDFICNSQPGASAQQNGKNHGRARPSGPQIRWLTSPLLPSSSLTAQIEVLLVLTSTRILVGYSDEYSNRKILVSGSPICDLTWHWRKLTFQHGQHKLKHRKSPQISPFHNTGTYVKIC